MIGLYLQDDESSSLTELVSRARRLLRRGEPRSAATGALPGLARLHAEEDEYLELVAVLGQSFERLDRPREALTLAWYARDPEPGQRLSGRVPAIDAARSRLLQGSEQATQEAARELEQAGFLARAAVQYERRGDRAAARVLWSRLSQLLDGSADRRYEAGLAFFNVARTTESEQQAARSEACIAAVSRLEEAADHFGAIGQRERAFDCYHVLVAIGRLSGSFEHVLEGVINVVRILCEDNLERHAVRWYVHAIRLATDAGEIVAAATLARDLANYARRRGEPVTVRAAALCEAGLWSRAAARLGERGASPELVENALVAAAVAYAEIEHYRQVARTFRELSKLEIGRDKQQTYERAGERFARASDGPAPPALDSLDSGFVEPPPVWHDDLIEWENRGSAVETCADTLNDPEIASDPITRRAALCARLVALAVDDAQGDARRDGQVRLAERLAAVGTYGSLSAIEQLYRSDQPEVRRAAVRSLGRYPYKRSFATLEAAAEDPDPGVRRDAASAIERLRFEHAFDPLARIFRSSGNGDARLAALRALCALDLREAAELAIGVLEHGNKAERAAVTAALRRQPTPALREAARRREVQARHGPRPSGRRTSRGGG